MKEVKIKVEFLGVISKVLYENETVSKTSICGDLNFSKRPNTKSSKIAGVSRMFFA